MRRGRRNHGIVELQMGPMIDMVFLLLVFFMVTAKPIKQESDISIGLPGAVEQEEVLDIPDEQRIVIEASGQVVLNELEVDGPSSRELPELVAGGHAGHASGNAGQDRAAQLALVLGRGLLAALLGAIAVRGSLGDLLRLGGPGRGLSRLGLLEIATAAASAALGSHLGAVRRSRRGE